MVGRSGARKGGEHQDRLRGGNWGADEIEDLNDLLSGGAEEACSER